MKRTELKRRYRNTGPPAAVVEAVLERAQYSCELDGAQIGDRRGVDYHVHHRRPRRMGGSQLADTNAPQNLMILCSDCHTTVESERRASYAGGWLVRQNQDPARVPVLVLARSVFLTVDGGYDALPERVT